MDNDNKEGDAVSVELSFGVRSRLSFAVLLATCALSPAARAQSASDVGKLDPGGNPATARAARARDGGNVLEEVVVTASRRRSENVQRTPVAITSISASTLAQRHVTNFQQAGDLAPNLQIAHSSGSSGVADVYLRGFGQNSNDPAVDPHVAIFIDGIYQPSPVGTLLDLFDIEQVEVDAGPQGTLAGKNAPVGAIYISTAKPSNKFGGTLEADYGSYDNYGLRGAVTGPVWQQDGRTILAAKFSIASIGGGNWVKNLYNDRRDFGGNRGQTYRVALAFTPTDELSWNVTGSVQQNIGEQPGSYNAGYLGGFPGSVQSALQTTPYQCLILGPSACPKQPYGTTDSSYTTRPKFNEENVSSTLTYRLAPVTVTLVDGFVGLWDTDNNDDAGTSYVALNAYHDRTTFDQESAELRVASNKGGGADLGGRIDWVAGGYFSAFDYTDSHHLGIGVLSGFTLPVGVANVSQAEKGREQSEALFLHVIGNISDKWNATFGVRESYDEKHHSFMDAGVDTFAADDPAFFRNTSFEAGTSYKIDRLRLVYFRFAEGYESGGFSGFAVGNKFNPELNKAYEIGLKSDWLDRRLRINADVFRNDLSQLQVESALAIPTPPGFLQETLNAGAAQVQGAELQVVVVPIDALTVHLNLGYLDARYLRNESTTCSNTSFPTDCSGLNFAYAPKWTIDVGGQYTQHLPRDLGSLIFSADLTYKSHVYTQDPVYPSSNQAGYGLLSANLAYHDPSERYSVEVYGTNITNRHYIIAYTDPAGLAAWDIQGRPAEWGVRLTGKF